LHLVVRSEFRLLFFQPNVRVEVLVDKLVLNSRLIDVLVLLGRIRYAARVTDVLPLGTHRAEVDDKVEVCSNVLGPWVVLQNVAFVAEIRAQPTVSTKWLKLGFQACWNVFFRTINARVHLNAINRFVPDVFKVPRLICLESIKLWNDDCAEI
jgi:hypothetical protein